MKVLVVYDSVFGNTERAARAIGDALGSLGEVEMARVGEVEAERLTGLAVGRDFVRLFGYAPATIAE